MLQPTVDITPGRVLGVSVGPYWLVSKEFSGVGMSVGVLLGRAGHKKGAAEARRMKKLYAQPSVNEEKAGKE
jgi:hypothetical protein